LLLTPEPTPELLYMRAMFDSSPSSKHTPISQHSPQQRPVHGTSNHMQAIAMKGGAIEVATTESPLQE
jgi:hypothetical protein